MAIVAVAGGSGNIGRAVVEAILAVGKHDVKILSRKPNPTLEAELGVPIIAVDYNEVEALTKVLEDNNIDTVISTMSMIPSPTGGAPKEIELIRAADASKTTKRMVSSDWSFPHSEDHGKWLGSVRPKLDALEELKRTTDLETTHVVVGFFADYWSGPGGPKSYMPPLTMVIDIPNSVAAIPGDGNMPIIFTHSIDVGKFVAAMLELEKWDPVSYIIGDKMTCNELLHLAEEVKGAHFKVTYDSVEMLRGGQYTELPGHIGLYGAYPKQVFQRLAAGFGLWFAEGAVNYHPEKTLNDSFPEIEPIKMEDLLRQGWGGLYSSEN